MTTGQEGKDPTWKTPQWVHPETLEETELRLANLTEEVLCIQAQLGDDTARGMLNSTDWRHHANVAVRYKQSEIRFLKTFLHAFNQKLYQQTHPMPEPGTWAWYKRALSTYREALQRLVKEGVDVGDVGREALALVPPQGP